MPHRNIPVLPSRPHVHPLLAKVTRSYPVGRESFSRACQCDVLVLRVTTVEPLAPNVRVSLMTTLNSSGGASWTRVMFERTDEHTLTCRITPQYAGLHSFRGEFSLDGGATWLRDNVPDAWVLIDPPQVDALRVYSLIPTVSGTLGDWKQDLKRISDMGFNAIHLLPVTEMDTSQSPYSAKDLFEVDHSYLISGLTTDGLAQLEDFIAAAKALGIRLIFDLVLNHVGVHSNMATTAPDWIAPDQNQPDGLHRARYWSGHAWINWNDLVLINYEHTSDAIRAEIWNYMIDYALFWAKYANDTGGFVRFDNLHSSDPSFVSALTTALHREYPGVGILAEYFTDESTLLRTGPKWGLNLHLATPWDCKFVPQLRDYLTYIHRVSEHVRYFMPVTSHDSGSPAQEFGSVDSTIPRYVAAALLGTGATGIPQGVEFGEKEKINFIGRQPKMQFPSDPRFADFIRRVNTILAEHPTFRRGDNCWFVDNGHSAILAAFRRDSEPQTQGFLIVCNFDISSPQHITIELGPILTKDGPFTCHDLLSDQAHVFPHPRLELVLPPCGAQVLKF
jgi:Glycogen debranching enzyme, glucanotransferase domain